MKPAQTLEERLLQPAERELTAFARNFGNRKDEAWLQVLEAAASRLGGFDLAGFQQAFGTEPITGVGPLMDAGRRVVAALQCSGIPPALALSALAREELDASCQRGSGAYHTDFRLAQHLASALQNKLRPGVQVIDPACGAGMLLSAVSLAACGQDRVMASDWLASSVHASDLSAAALRGTLIALASLTNDLRALRAMRARWQVQDSLLASEKSWRLLAAPGFDVVVANPPWEKVKLSRHEFIRSNGGQRHYGAEYAGDSLLGYDVERNRTSNHASLLATRYPALREGEADLYVAFTELLLNLTKPGGSGALLVPGGLIRSKNTEALRRTLLRRGGKLSFTVMENRARFFAIDTRFKFLVVQFDAATGRRVPRTALQLSHGTGGPDGVAVTPPVRIGRTLLEQVRPDLTVPEVRDAAEWRLFLKMQRNGLEWSAEDNPWHPEFCREVDMTHARKHFVDFAGRGCLPLVEGRMVQPHRFGAKAYAEGSGRKARWVMLPPGGSAIVPQFWVPEDSISASACRRSRQLRVGFCDITGQTNERSMMAAVIPPGVTCGNKVPTLLFPNDPGEERIHLWVAIVNSLPFDWLLRRVVTTTVNYFLLLGLRLPRLQPDSLPGRRLCDIARRLAALDVSGASSPELAWRAATLRAEADVLVASAYGCAHDDLLRMFADFPLLDRGQPALAGEEGSTVTRDLVLSTWGKRRRGGATPWTMRVEAATRIGAIPYVPGEFGGDEEDGGMIGVG